MKRTELLKEIVKKQDEIIQLLSYNDAFFNVRIAVLNEEVTVLKADLKNKLEECGKYKAIKVDTGGENNCNNCKWGICLTKDWPCNDCNGSNKWEPINE